MKEILHGDFDRIPCSGGHGASGKKEARITQPRWGIFKRKCTDAIRLNAWRLLGETWRELEMERYLHPVGDNTEVKAKVTEENV